MHKTPTQIGCLAVGVMALGAMVSVTGSKVAAQVGGAPILYDQGDPTDDEQYLLQQLNRARMDPVGEGQRLAAWLRANPAIISQYGLNPEQVAADFATLPPVPPLAFNADLIAAAEAHSADLAAHGGVGPSNNDHAGYDGSSPISRVKASGYKQGYAGENAGGGLKSLDEIHAAYLVDWGVANLGHRQQSMNGSNASNVIGLGVAALPDNLLAETEEYGMPNLTVSSSGFANADVPALLTGVVYSDANGNGQYDPGEGVAGASVTMDGGAYYAVTSASGGYSLPLVNADGTNADGSIGVRMTFADGGSYAEVIAITHYRTAIGSYRGNVEWSAKESGASVPPIVSPPVTPTGSVNLDKPYFSGASMIVSAGQTVKIKVFRPANSDMNQPYTFSYKVKGTAVAGVDYIDLPTTGTIHAGKPSVNIKVNAMANSNASVLKLKLVGVKQQGTAIVTIAP